MKGNMFRGGGGKIVFCHPAGNSAPPLNVDQAIWQRLELSNRSSHRKIGDYDGPGYLGTFPLMTLRALESSSNFSGPKSNIQIRT